MMKINSRNDVRVLRHLVRWVIPVCALALGHSALGQLAVSFGPSGLQRLSYGSVLLEDEASFPADAFHIGHMKVTDLGGNTLPADGWGENSKGKTWDPGSHAWTYQFAWGSIRCAYVQAGERLNLVVTVINRPGSGVIVGGASIYPLALHFPSLPSGFDQPGYPQIVTNSTAPGVILANFGMGEVASVVPDASKPIYSGFSPGGSGPVYSVLLSSTTPDGLATFVPHHDRPVSPGQADTFTVSLRFAPSGTAVKSLVADAYANWGTTWPAKLNWKDRRIIGTSFLASAPAGRDVSRPGGYPGNPRRYFNVNDPNEIDIRTPAGLLRFQKRVLEHAGDITTNLKRMNAQGVITWDIEGEEYPQSTSYVCSPDRIADTAPEMESIVTDPASPYAGMKLDDAFFKTISKAGFRVGVCIRPQQFVKAANGTAQQVNLNDKAAETAMLQKIRYAHDRWGATLFYLDSTVEPNGMPLDAGILQRLAAAFPDSLLIPEESSPRDYAYTAPFKTFLFHRETGTDASVRAYYPRAFSCNMVNDVDPAKLAEFMPQLTASVAAGDILMAVADYWQANNSTIAEIYQRAGHTTVPASHRPSANASTR